MNQSIIDIKAGRLFPWQFLVIGALITLCALVLVATKPLVGLLLLMIGGFILTASEGTDIDGTQKRYREYTSYFFIKNGKWITFDAAEKLFINSVRKSAKMYTASTLNSSTFVNTEFNGYLKLSDGTKLHLLSHTKKEKLATVLQNVASLLNIPIQDNTLA